jgi:hypothetical protein
MSAVFWLGVACLFWAGVAAGMLWALPPAAACSVFGAVDLWEAFAADEED